MILRSLSVANWRCFLEAVRLGPFTDGLNIVHAPNGTGKSTLFEAMRCGLLDGHRVGGREVEGMRPWGRELAPRVEVEFIHGGTEYRITKQFLSNPSALLQRKEGGHYRPLAEGSKADEQTRILISQNPPGKGLAKLANWGLAQVLWAPQGNLALLSLSEDLVTNIRSILSAQVSGSGTDPIEARIQERYLEFFTPAGKLKTGKQSPPLVAMERELEQSVLDMKEAQRLQLEFEDASRRLEDLGARRHNSRLISEEITKALGEARQQAQAYRELSAEKIRRSALAGASEAQYVGLKQRIGIIQQTEKALLDARSTISAIEAEMPLKAREARERAKQAERTRAALEDARKGRNDVDQAEKAADDGRQFAEGTKRKADLNTIIERIRSTQQVLANRKRQHSEMAAPDDKVLQAIRKAIKERDEAQVRLEASLITLEVALKEEGQVDIVAGEQTGSLRLSAGVPTRIQGSPEVVAVIPGVARLRAWGPVGSVDVIRSARLKAEEKIEKLTAPYGTGDLTALEALAEQAAVLKSKVREAETQLETQLSGKSVEEIVHTRNILETELTRVLEAHPEWGQLPPDPLALRSLAGDVKRSFIAKVENAEAERDKAQSALTSATGQEERLAERLKEARILVASLEENLAEQTNDGKQTEDRERELGQLAIAWHAAKARLTEIEDKLKSYQDDPDAVVQKLEKQLDGASQEATRMRELELREETRLEALSARGPYSMLALAEEKVSRLGKDVQREHLRMDAIQLLRNTVSHCRAEVIATVAEPVETAATKLFQRIVSRRLGRIRIGEALQPSGVVPEILNDAVAIDDISGGEQEQLYLATRLALAEVLAREERQLVVLDDVLTATDTGRLARVMTILEEAAQRLQILVLTCHPERYRGLSGATFFDLEGVLHGQ